MSIELKEISIDDLAIDSKIFANDNDNYGKLGLVDFYGVLYPNGLDKKPIWFIRHCNPDKIRFGGVMEPSDDILGLQTALHKDDLAQKEDLMVPYQKINENCFGISCQKPFFEYRCFENYATFKEADVFDLRADYYPKAIYKHANKSTFISQITQPCELYGTYHGKPVRGLGNFELCYFPKTETRDLNEYAAYIYSYCSGIRKDGRREVMMVYLNLDGRGTGFYYLEGEKPVFSENVEMNARWYKLPYMQDGTCTYKNAIFRFGGKEIHFIGKWGYKGLTAYPRVELSGQSQNMGTFYEGKKPYEHEISLTFNENMLVYDYKLKQLGFEVEG
ncbi:MAG: hypothetical protein ACOX1F_02730 [Erysipelotrichaceae bacterium]|jgi:hypothetical protein